MHQQVSDLRVVGPSHRFSKVALIKASPCGYLLLAAEVDRRPPFAYRFQSTAKRDLLECLKDFETTAHTMSGLLDSVVLKATLIPPTSGKFLRSRPGVPIARYDVAMVMEFDSPDRARTFASTEAWQALLQKTQTLSKKSLSLTATNARRIGPVEHGRDGVFLLNYFYADDMSLNLAVWEYTAGWFTDETGLNNSTLLLPDASHPSPYTIINHCRWDSVWNILPQLLFYRTFRTFVLANFDANRTAAMPVLYKRA